MCWNSNTKAEPTMVGDAKEYSSVKHVMFIRISAYYMSLLNSVLKNLDAISDSPHGNYNYQPCLITKHGFDIIKIHRRHTESAR